MTSPVRHCLGGFAVAALSVLTWVAWLGWDHEYQLDAATGTYSGPYAAWQVIGCALTLAGVLVAATWAGVPPLAGSAAMTVAFTAAWTTQAAAGDTTGLYGVGAVMLLFGLGTATVLVSFLTRHLLSR